MGPRLLMGCSIYVERIVNSQSSINSQKWGEERLGGLRYGASEVYDGCDDGIFEVPPLSLCIGS